MLIWLTISVQYSDIIVDTRQVRLLVDLYVGQDAFHIIMFWLSLGLELSDI